VCLVADRDLSRHGVEVEFFGARTRMPGGPATLAIRTGAILLPAAVWYDGPRWAARVGPEVPVPADGTEAEKVASMTQQLADHFAAAIAEHPQDWHMLQRLWLDDLHPDDPRRASDQEG
jgi:phosphatidylinositol dimannoside acyltransferase